MNLWDQVVIALLGVGGTLLAAGILFGVRELRRRAARGGPDFTLTRMADGNWTLERVKKTTAYEVCYGHVEIAGGDHQSLINFSERYGNDMRHGDGRWVNRPPGPVWFTWIDGTRRYCRAVDLASTERVITITAAEPSPTGKVNT